MAEQGFAVRLSARVDGYLAAMEQAKKATKGVADEGGVDLQRLGGKMHDVGSKMTAGLTLPLIAVGGIAVKMSSDFSGAFARMQGLAGVTADEVDGLKAAVLDLAGETGQAPQDLADGLYFLRSSGLDSAKAMDALKVSAQASSAGLGSTAVIADAVSSAMNAYAKSGLSAAEATDILVGTARAGKAEPAELAGALGRVLPVASELGITFEDVGGAIAAMSLSGNDASTSATLLSNIMTKMLKPSQQGAEALAAVGMSTDSIRQSIADKGLLATLEDLKTRLGDAGFVKFLEDAQAVQGALALTGQNAEQVHATFDTVANSAGLTGEAFGAMAETSGFKMKQAWADVQVSLIQAGDIIIPIVAGIAGAIGNLASTFSDLPGPVQAIVIALLGLVAAAGPVLLVGGSLVRNFNDVKKAMAGMGAGASNAAIALGAIGLVLVVATKLYSNNAEQKAKLAGVTDLFTDALAREAAGQKDAVAESIAAQLSNKNLIADATRLGLSINDLADIVAGKSVPAWEALRKTQEGDPLKIAAEQGEDAGAAFLRLNESLGMISKGLTGARDQATLTAQVERELAAATTETDRETRRLYSSTTDLGTAAGGLVEVLPLSEEELKANADATTNLGKALDNSTNRFDLLASAAGLLSDALDAVFGPYQDLEQANRNLQEAAAATTQAFKDNGATLDINTEKGRSNREVVEAQAKAALDYGATLVGQGKSTEEATNATNFLIESLKETMRQGGLSEEQIAEYITTLGLTPENVTTAVNLANDEATKIRLGEIQEQLGDIDAGAAAEIQALIEEGKFAEAEARLREIAKDKNIKLNLVPGSGLRLDVRTGSAFLVGVTSEGGVFDREQLRSISEGGQREAVLPLTKPARLAQLLADPRVGGPVVAALASNTPGSYTSASGMFTPAIAAGMGPSPAPTPSPGTHLRDVTLVNNRQDLTVDEFSRVLAMTRLAS